MKSDFPVLQSAPLPAGSRAVDDPQTGAVLVTTWRRGLVRLVVWTVVWALLTLAVIVIRDRDLETVRAVFLLLMFVSLRPLALASLSMQTVRAIDTALGQHSWQYCESVRRVRGTRVRGGIPVQIKVGDGEDDWSPVMKARAPFRWRRWTAEMESGAWFAGDVERGGVVALPGGRALTLVTVAAR
ncbi:hypothetical protein [Streptomyces bicolor]|uniref:hypothetical protein n=1 Tax=Streptomyces bicolor TaxID=66874 RepID=UPI0004E1069E|nr:hypothetical protein [Streptomyces bicolor]